MTLVVASGRNFATTSLALACKKTRFSEHCTYTKKAENPKPCSRLTSTTYGGPRNQDRIQQLVDRYTLKTVEPVTFRFCGRDVVQHPDFSISVRCNDTTEKIEPVRDHEIAQLRSVVGSLAWVAGQCRPQLSYGVNKLQSVCGTATLDHLRFANKLLQEAKDSPDDGLFFKSGLFTWDKMEILPTPASETSRTSAVKKGG